MAIQGPIPVEFGQVFPAGVYAAGGFEAVRDFDASTNGRFVQSKDKQSGLPLWTVEVIDGDAQARTRTVKVKVAAQVQPVLPSGFGGGAVRAGGVHRAHGHAVRDAGRKARLLLQGVRGPLTWPSVRSSGC